LCIGVEGRRDGESVGVAERGRRGVDAPAAVPDVLAVADRGSRAGYSPSQPGPILACLARSRHGFGILGTMAGKSKKAKKPPLDKQLIGERLERARKGQLLVSVRRWIPRADAIDGFVTGIGSSWVVMSKFTDEVHLDGWTLLRLKDIQAVSIEPDPDCFEVKALRARSEWPPPVADVALDDVAEALRSAAAADELTTVFVEFYRPDVCWIGTPTSIGRRTLRLREVGPRADWHRKPRPIDLEDVTRIEFGGDYEEALRLVAGPPPRG